MSNLEPLKKCRWYYGNYSPVIDWTYGWFIGWGVYTRSQNFPKTSALVREVGRMERVENIELDNFELFEWDKDTHWSCE